MVYLPPAADAARKSQTLLPSIIKYILGRRKDGAASSSSTSTLARYNGNTLVIMTKNRLKVWEDALGKASHEGAGKVPRRGGQQQEQLYMCYTAGPRYVGKSRGRETEGRDGLIKTIIYFFPFRERARLAVNEICQYTFVLTTWDVFRAQEVSKVQVEGRRKCLFSMFACLLASFPIPFIRRYIHRRR